MLKKVTITNVNTGHKSISMVDTDTHEKALIGSGISANETASIEDITGPDEKLQRMTSPKGGTDDCAAFFSGLGRCLERNISMTKSLKLQVNRVVSARYKGMIAEVIHSISMGEKFSDAMSRYRDIFSEDILSLIIAGEEAGQLARVCKRIGVAQKKSSKTLKKLKGAMIYPAVVTVLGVIVVIIMSFTLVPAMSKLFLNFGTELPFATKSLIALSNLFIHQPYMAAAPLVALYIFFSNFSKFTALKWVQDLALKIPVVGMLVRKSAAASGFRTLAMLTESNVRLTSALEITSSATWHYHYKEFFNRLRDHISVGRTLHEGFLMESHWLGADGRNLCGLIELASETGSGTEMLAEIADDYEEELDNMAASLDKLIEPLTMLILGVMVGFLIYAIYGPMFSLGDVILKKK
ncbi:type II secretion system F family protein [Prosthecobacter sp. SYSU 5D2]|uniref:type II secretion system F family protein n=1 Tax=Prosthecobacter sp. SYSU 5D2 TaxID=3134134 RepID=UPI0031FE8639